MTNRKPISLDRRTFTRSLLALAAGAGAYGSASPLLAASNRTSQHAADHHEHEKAKMPALASSQSQFGYNFIKAQAAKAQGANVIFSPASAGGALSLIAIGDDEKLRKSIYKVLELGKKGDKDLKTLQQETAHAPEGGPLIIANALMVDQAATPNKNKVEAVKNAGAQFFDDLAFGKPEAVEKVNQWVAQNTKGHIDKLFDTLPSDTGLVALNALYFKDQWKQPFDPKKTAGAPFRLVGGGTADAKLMHGESGDFAFRSNNRFTAADILFNNPDYRLTVVTSLKEPLPAADFEPVSSWLAGGDGFKVSKGQISMPLLQVSTSVDLKASLLALGLDNGEIKGFSKDPLHLGAAQQRIELVLNEEGAEAAAATGITAERSLNANIIDFVVDKPYIFSLRNVQTGLVLVAGYVAKPQ